MCLRLRLHRIIGTVVLALVVSGAAAVCAPGRARAQGFLHLMVGGGADTRGSGALDARVGIFRTLQLQGGLSIGILRGHPGPGSTDSAGARAGDYTLTQAQIGLAPYIGLASWLGISPRAAVGGGLLSAPDVNGTREAKMAWTLEAGAAVHFWMASFLGLAVEVDYRLIGVVNSFRGFPERTHDVVGRLMLEIAIPGS